MRGEIVAVDFTEADHTTLTVRVPPGEPLASWGHWLVEVTPVEQERPAPSMAHKSPSLSVVAVGRKQVVGGVTHVHIGPSRPRKRDGFDSVVQAIYATNPVTVDVLDPYNGALRTLPITRIQRVLG